MADNKTNLVDLTLLNTAYKINKKRIDLLSEKVKTKNLEVVDTATTNGTLTVNSGNFSADTLAVTGGMTINGGGVTLPSGTALTLSKGGSVTKSATFDSLTGSVKFGNAVDSNGVVSGSAQIVVPSGKSLSLSGNANVNSNTTIEGTITSGNIIATKITANGSAVLNGSTISSDTTISNGTIDLNKKTLQLSEGSTTNTSKISNGTISTSITNSGTTGSIDLNNQTLKLSSTSTSSLSGGTISTSITNSGTVGGSIDLNNQTLKLSSTSTSSLSSGTISTSITNSGAKGGIDLNSQTLQLSGGSTSKISNGIISASITNSKTTGSIDLNGNDLTVTNDSIITAIIEGDKTTIEGVAAIKAKSMELTNTANNSSSLIINNTFGGNITDPNADLSKVALYCTGGIKGAKVFNAVWNDLADAIEVPSDTELEFGYCYKYKEGKVYKTDSYADANVMGIHSDTAGMVLGTKDKGTVCINLAVAGVVLAYVDKEYECGTALVATKEGRLTKANRRTRLFHPERIVATFYKTEIQDFWGSSTHKVAVNGRSWVKVK